MKWLPQIFGSFRSPSFYLQDVIFDKKYLSTQDFEVKHGNMPMLYKSKLHVHNCKWLFLLFSIAKKDQMCRSRIKANLTSFWSVLIAFLNVLRKSELSFFLESWDEAGHDANAFGRKFKLQNLASLGLIFGPILTLIWTNYQHENHQQILLFWMNHKACVTWHSCHIFI